MAKTLVAKTLAWLGRWGTQAIVLSVVLGLAAPPLAAAARPLLPWTVLVFLTLMFARADIAAIRVVLSRPGRLALALGWLVLVPPLCFYVALGLVGRHHLDPGLLLGLAMQAAAPPLASVPAIAMLLGLRPTLIMIAVLTTTIASALTSPLLVDWVAGAAVPIDQAVLVRRLALMIGGSLAAALVLRRVVGAARLETNARSLDGVGVVMYVVFGVAAMDGVAAATLADPWRSLGFTTLTFAIAAAGLLGSWTVLRPFDPRDRLAIGYGTGMRNGALQIAALGAAVPDTAYLYFALSQLPIYILPYLLRHVVRRRGLGQDAAVPDRQGGLDA